MPFPLPLGSQVFLAGQAAALARAGARVDVFCYGAGEAAEPGSAAHRALHATGVRWRRADGRLSRTPLRSGPSWRKPLADASLLATLHGAGRRAPFAALLAHNAEAVAVAAGARALGGAPVVYVAHTLWRHELGSWFPWLAPRVAARLGAALDGWLAARADAVVALSEAARLELAGRCAGPVVRIPPGLDAAPPPPADEVAAACARHGLRPGGFALHAGNLDRYQELETLARAAAQVPELPFVVATHDRSGTVPRPLRELRLEQAAEARALMHGSALAVLARRIPGGFPVKLLNAMEAQRPIVARRSVADGLAHGSSAWLLPDAAGPDAFVRAVRALLADPAGARRIGAGGRRHLESRHGWGGIAAETLALVAAAAAARQARRSVRPGRSPVCRPSSTTSVPFTQTRRTPSGVRRGSV